MPFVQVLGKRSVAGRSIAADTRAGGGSCLCAVPDEY